MHRRTAASSAAPAGDAAGTGHRADFDTVQGSLDAAADPETVAALPTVTLITTIDTGQLRTDPLISDPVSGGGNPSLWDTPDEQNDRREDDAKPTPRQGDHK